MGADNNMAIWQACATRADAAVMNRSALTSQVAQLAGEDAAIVGGIGHTNFDLWASGQRPRNFYMLGSMGLAAPIALGVAVAQPHRRVVALEGDGSVLMQLGTLGTIAAAGAGMLVVVWDNGCYQITGAQTALTSQTVDLVGVGRACGLARSAWAADTAHFDALVRAALDADGPSLIVARTDDAKPAGTTDRDPARIRQVFMQGLGVNRHGQRVEG